MPGAPFDAVVFDKDGTLVDFHETWDAAFGELLTVLTDGDERARAAAAAAVGYELASATIPDTSPIIAESTATLAAMMAPALARDGDPGLVAEIDARLGRLSLDHLAAAPGADDALAALGRAGVPMAVATNDAEQTARMQIEQLGWAGHFGAVIGHDSGHGSKPEPAMVLACLDQLEVEPAGAVMVGDSRHDLEAARRAGAGSILVGGMPELRAHADHAIADLADLPALVIG